jgi:hypothetical protein
MVLHVALSAVGREFSARHGHEGTIRTLNDFQISNDKAVVESDGAEGFEAVSWFFHELDANLGDIHSRSPYEVAQLTATSGYTDKAELLRPEYRGQPTRMLRVAADSKIGGATAGELMSEKIEAAKGGSRVVDPGRQGRGRGLQAIAH